ncbi:MAG: AI-2E family transporter [Treponema sp.]|nr:AI-2E family transporter [Treponema sp.]
MKQNDFNHYISYMLIFLTTIVLFAVLKATESVIVPILISVILSFVMLPVVNGMKKIHIPYMLGVSIVTILLIFFIIAFGSLITVSLRTIITQYPKYEEKLNVVLVHIAEKFQWQFVTHEFSFLKNIQVILNEFVDIGSILQKLLTSFSQNTISLLKTTMMIILMFIFLLMEVSITNEKLSEAFEGKLKNRMPVIAKRIMFQVMRFLSIKFFISLVTGFLVYLSVELIGLDFPIVWGALAFILNFIPNFGSIVSVGMTTLFALLQFFPNPLPIIFIFVITISINMTLGNIIEPRIAGHDLGLSPFVILIMLSLWGWLWGFVGMILAVPLTVVIKIICENVSLLHPIAILIGNKPQDTKKEFPSDEQNTSNTTTV